MAVPFLGSQDLGICQGNPKSDHTLEGMHRTLCLNERGIRQPARELKGMGGGRWGDTMFLHIGKLLTLLHIIAVPLEAGHKVLARFCTANDAANEAVAPIRSQELGRKISRLEQHIVVS